MLYEVDPRIGRIMESVGVPDAWREDCIQEIAIRAWRNGKDQIDVARSVSIDMARKFGSVSRRGVNRDAFPMDWRDESNDPTSDPYATIDAMIDAERVISALPERQKRALGRAALGMAQEASERPHLTRAREALRASA